MRSTSLLLTLAAFGCTPDAPVDSAAEEACQVTIKETTPTTGSIDAYYRGTIEFVLSGADPTAEIETDIPGTQSVRDNTIVWTPSAALSPSTQYSATLHYCGGDATIDFTTSALGTALEPALELVGKTYNLKLGDARIVEPPGVGGLLSEYLDVAILAGVTTVTDTQIEMLGSLGKEDAEAGTVQDFCNPTIPFPVADFTGSPYFLIAGDGATEISVAGYTIAIENLEISGTFAANGDHFGGGTLKGTIDTRPFDDLIEEGAEPGAVCELVPSFGVDCEECPGKPGEVFCLSIAADSIKADEVATTVVKMAGNDCTTADDESFDSPNACELWTAETLPPEAEMVCKPDDAE